MLWCFLGGPEDTQCSFASRRSAATSISLPRRERARGRPPCSAGDQGAGPDEVDAAGALDSLIAFLSEVVEQDGRRAKLGTAPGPTIDPICRALGIARTPVFEELPPPKPDAAPKLCGA